MLLRSAGAAGGPFGGFRHDHQLCDFLTDVGIFVGSGFFGAFDNKIHSPGALRVPLIGLIGRFEFDTLFGVNPSRA